MDGATFGTQRLSIPFSPSSGPTTPVNALNVRKEYRKMVERSTVRLLRFWRSGEYQGNPGKAL
jgi:hypothetical protein